MAKRAASSNRTPTSLSDKTQDVVDKFNASWDYAKQNHHSRWKRNWKLYNNERSIISFKGITNTFVPMTFSVVETITSALAAGRPSIDFAPQDMYKYIMSYYESGTKPDLKALNAQFDYYWDCDNWDLKSIKTIRNGLIYGTSAEFVYWDTDKPRIVNLRTRDLIVDPNVTDPMQLITDPDRFYAGRRYMTTKKALEDEEIVDVNNPGKTVKRYKNLNKVNAGYKGDKETDDDRRDIYTGALSSDADLLEVIEIWDGKKVRSVANREQLIEERDNTIGIIPIVIHRFIADESIIYGKAIVDPIAHSQELLNDVTNQSVDAVTDILSPQAELDPTYADFLDQVTTAPGTVYPFTPGSLKYIDKPTVTPQAFNERLNMKNEINEATGVDQIMKGVNNDQTATATEINAQLATAGQRFELYVRMLEKEAFYQRAKIVYAMMRHYVTDKQLVPTNSVDGPKFHAFDPTQFDETYEPKIQLEASVQNGKARQQQSSTQAFTAIIADPTNNLWQAKKLLYPKMFDISEEELDLIIGSQEPPPPAPPMGPEGMPPEAPELPPELAAEPMPEELPAEVPV